MKKNEIENYANIIILQMLFVRNCLGVLPGIFHIYRHVFQMVILIKRKEKGMEKENGETQVDTFLELVGF